MYLKNLYNYINKYPKILFLKLRGKVNSKYVLSFYNLNKFFIGYTTNTHIYDKKFKKKKYFIFINKISYLFKLVKSFLSIWNEYKIYVIFWNINFFLKNSIDKVFKIHKIYFKNNKNFIYVFKNSKWNVFCKHFKKIKTINKNRRKILNVLATKEEQ